jgi:hypothetical protein
MQDYTKVDEHGTVQRFVDTTHRHPGCEAMHWVADWKLEKFDAGSKDVLAGTYQSATNASLGRLGEPVRPTEVHNEKGNLLLNGGGDVLWLGLIGSLSATTNVANTYFNNANAGIRVSTSNTAAANTQTNIQGTTKYTKGMDATYPTHTTGTASTAAKNITFKATFTTSQANFAWNEWCIVNRTAQTGGRALNRKVQSLGTKTSAATWAFTVTLSLA